MQLVTSFVVSAYGDSEMAPVLLYQTSAWTSQHSVLPPLLLALPSSACNPEQLPAVPSPESILSWTLRCAAQLQLQHEPWPLQTLAWQLQPEMLLQH